MKLEEIRKKVGYSKKTKTSLKQWLRIWLASSNNYQMSITVMPKKQFVKHLPSYYNSKKKVAQREMTKAELKAAYERLMAIINEQVHKKAYKRFGRKLNAVAAIEGERSFKDLHLHIAIGAKPSYLTFAELKQRIEKAIRISGDFETDNTSYVEGKSDDGDKYRYKVDIMDSGWVDYITKEMAKDNIDNLLL